MEVRKIRPKPPLFEAELAKILKVKKKDIFFWCAKIVFPLDKPKSFCPNM